MAGGAIVGVVDACEEPAVTLVERVEFFRVAKCGVVHVRARYQRVAGHPFWRRSVARCGRQGRVNFDGDGLHRFDDVELCARCWQATEASDRPDLFQHPQDTP